MPSDESKGSQLDAIGSLAQRQLDNTGQTIVKPTALGPVANTDTKLLIYGLFQKGRVLAQDAVVMVVLFAILPRELETLQQSAKRRSE